MPAQRFLVAAGVMVLFAARPASAELADATLGQKMDWASHVFTGEVLGIYSSYQKFPNDGTATHLVLKLRVDAVEKGEGIRAGQVVYAACWRAGKRLPVITGSVLLGTTFTLVGPSGHRRIPNLGETVRLFLRLAPEGEYQVFLPNGIDLIGEEKPFEPMPFDEPTTRAAPLRLGPHSALPAALLFVLGVLGGMYCSRRGVPGSGGR